MKGSTGSILSTGAVSVHGGGAAGFHFGCVVLRMDAKFLRGHPLARRGGWSGSQSLGCGIGVFAVDLLADSFPCSLS